MVEKLHGAFKEALEDPKFKKTMDMYDMFIYSLNLEGLAKEIKETSDQWGTLITQWGLKAK